MFSRYSILNNKIVFVLYLDVFNNVISKTLLLLSSQYLFRLLQFTIVFVTFFLLHSFCYSSDETEITVAYFKMVYVALHIVVALLGYTAKDDH